VDVKLARDTWLIYQRQMLLTVRSPMLIIFGLAQPVTYLVIFTPFLLPGLASLGATNYADAYRMYVPGLLVAMCLFGGLFAGFGLLAELRSGIIERCRVTQISRVALLLGRALRDVTTMLVQSVIITVAALPFGLSVPVMELVLAFVLLALIGLMTTAISYDLTLLIRSEQTLGQVLNVLTQPIALLAGVLIPLALAPAWIQNVALANPFSWATAGMRALFDGKVDDPTVWQSLIIVSGLAVLTVAWSARLFTRSVR
jgi:ABC-2 type transport system permease protein